MRLVDGTALNDGRVEICFNNAWGTICNSGFDRLDAGVICQQLGFSQFGEYIPMLEIHGKNLSL